MTPSGPEFYKHKCRVLLAQARHFRMRGEVKFAYELLIWADEARRDAIDPARVEEPGQMELFA